MCDLNILVELVMYAFVGWMMVRLRCWESHIKKIIDTMESHAIDFEYGIRDHQVKRVFGLTYWEICEPK